ncbi:cadherin-related family member 3 [Centrocercus urophasianus]|uniref:cadherin-related family member 3 n=1 Tax=Centrocercus urophasianus TaxID=9002 RepID=UPI001C64E1A4|nr:cadherin-related family member 3 [Centrocercus urophasianus]
MKSTFLLFILLGVVVSGRRTPLLRGLPATSTVEENAPAGVSIYTFNVTGSPLSSGVVAIHPTIVNSNPLTEAFAIVSAGDLVYRVVTTGNPILDYETMPKRFDLQIFVEDTAGRTDLNTLTVQVADKNERPVFWGNMAIQTVRIYVLEGMPPGLIYRVNATDPENGELKYSPLPESVPFQVLENGDIFSRKKIDYEKDPHCYFLNITATDPEGLNSTRTVNINIININDESPYFTTKQRIYRIPEEQSPGTVVANITAKDPDDEDSPSRLFYSIQSSDTYFSINPSTGVLQVSGRIDRDVLPLQLHPNVSMIIRVEDSPRVGHFSEMEITVIVGDINDNPPECNPSTFRKEIHENTTAGIVLLDLRNSCKDIDVDPPNNLFSFTGLSGFGSNNFALESAESGRLVMTESIDLENPSNPGVEVYSLTVRVQDIASPNYSNTIYIYIRIKPVNEFFPVFSSPSYEFYVPEITKVGSTIGKVTASDADWPPSVITYSIIAGGGTRDYTNAFWISPINGDVKILERLDYETTQKHFFTVQASDQERTATASVTVNVLEVNDEEPICSPNFYSFQIPVSLAVGTNVNGFRIQCQDRDSDPRSFRYFIEGNVNNHFTFSPMAGSNTSQLILASPFDYESGLDTKWIYRLRVYITDDNLLSVKNKATHLVKTGTVTLSIRVIPNPTTVTTTTPGFTVVTKKENLYLDSAWYVPFVTTLGSLLLLGLLGHLLARWLCARCLSAPQADSTPLINAPEKKKPKKEVALEMIKLNTVFDGEARDPVTGKMYEFNTQSGARRWKKSNEPLQPTADLQVRSSATGDGDQETDRPEVPSKKETSEKRKEPREAARPSAGPSLSPGQDGLEVPKQKGEPEDRELPSSAQQHRH